jgi:hypothetical protein
MKNVITLLVTLLALAPLSVFAQEFQTITGVPAFDALKGTGGADLAGFFNQLYVLAVGACAIIAVAQIMIAGFRWATAGGSHSTIEEARQGIQNSVLGLLLVLSPTIVFGIINPDILNLKIDTAILQERKDASEAGSPEPFSGEGTVAKISLKGNAWGAYDNVCDFKAGTGAFFGFHIPQEIAVKALGNGVSVSQGRQCCTLAGGTLKQVLVDAASGEQEMCDFQSVFESKKYVAHIMADITRLVTDGEGIVRGKIRIGHFFTSGGGSSGFLDFYSNGKRGGDSWFGDVDTQMIHSFRSRASCESFINSLTPDSLFNIFKERKMFSPAVGLLEAQNTLRDAEDLLNLNWGHSEELFPSALGGVEKIFDRWCDEVTVSKK